MNTPFEVISLKAAEKLTGLPSTLIEALALCGEIPSERRGGRLLVGKAALLSWCGLFAKILTAISNRHRARIGVSARNLVWLAQAGLLKGQERIAL